MARGTTRAPSQHAYRGTVGKTQTSTLHVTGARGETLSALVHTTVDAVSDPELAERLHSDDPARTLNVVRSDGGEVIKVAVPVVYHDPAAELLVLVLADAHRHREIDERIRLLERMRDEDAPIPPYAKEFAVVYGPAGLRSYLERRAQDTLATRDLEKRAKALDRQAAELAIAHGELERNRVELEKLRSDARNRVIAAVNSITDIEVDDETVALPSRLSNDIETKPVPKEELDDIEESLAQLAIRPEPPVVGVPARMRSDSENFDAIPTGIVKAPDFDEETTGATMMSHDTEPPMPIVAGAGPAATSSVIVEADGSVRIAVIAGDDLARALESTLEIRVLLHRTPIYPVITLVIGTAPALQSMNTLQLAVIPLDIASDMHRTVLTSLARTFEPFVEVIVRGNRVRRTRLAVPLAENVGYILRAADDHLRGLTSSGEGLPSFERGRDLVLGAGYDLLGAEHPDAGEFRDDKLSQLDSAQQLRRAIAIARRFARPPREDYLVCTRGFPLPRWRELRRHVLERAVAWGLWMGPDLAQVAVSEGLARSRRDLVIRLDHGFEALKRHPTAFDIDTEAADDNYQALGEEARALGVELSKPSTNGRGGMLVTSDAVSQVSGSIGQTPATGVPHTKSTDQLLAELEDRTKRVAAAIALCERADARAAAAVIKAVGKMSRAEAVRILGMSVKFGDAAAAPLTEGLKSSKGFLRHGCALALAMLRTEDGTQSVIELLLDEPTEIWREVARAIGQVGPTGLMPLASNYGRLGERATPQAAERVAWAMAHIAVRGGKAAVETMAAGHSVLAPVAKQALLLHASAANDQVRVRPGAEGSQVGKDVTVNRAFSRRFFEALEQGLPEAGAAELEALDESRPMELLDEADLIDEDEEAELDESDLIST